jgi:hypothetical protein
MRPFRGNSAPKLPTLAALPTVSHLHAGPMRDGWRPVRIVRQRDLKHAKLVPGHHIRLRVPVVEVADEGRPLCARGPLPVRDPLLRAREPELLVPPGELL